MMFRYYFGICVHAKIIVLFCFNFEVRIKCYLLQLFKLWNREKHNTLKTKKQISAGDLLTIYVNFSQYYYLAKHMDMISSCELCFLYQEWTET